MDQDKMKRSLKFALRFANTGKRKQLDDLWPEYQKAVNEFIFIQEIIGKTRWRDGKVKIGTSFKQSALRQASGILRTSKGNKLPKLTNPSMTLSQKFVIVQQSDNTFDKWIRISTLNKGKRIIIPIKSYQHANKYFKEWDLVKGGRLLRNKKGDWFIQLVFTKPKPKNTAKKTKGLDIGYRKLITDSDGSFYGTEIKALTQKAAKKKQGSKADKRAREEIKSYIGKAVKEAVDGDSNVIIEDLKNLKKNKKGKWSKKVNRLFNYWSYALTIQRLINRAEVVGVQCRSVDPSYTSQTCPSCGHVDKLNRKGERFACQVCDFKGDADVVGATNILQRFTQELTVPGDIKTHVLGMRNCASI